MSSPANDHLPKLTQAKFEELSNEIKVSYKSGAKFVGKVANHAKCGMGVFTWPNGARYEGEYADNVRNGKGLYQMWNGRIHMAEWGALWGRVRW